MADSYPKVNAIDPVKKEEEKKNEAEKNRIEEEKQKQAAEKEAKPKEPEKSSGMGSFLIPRGSDNDGFSATDLGPRFTNSGSICSGFHGQVTEEVLERVKEIEERKSSSTEKKEEGR